MSSPPTSSPVFPTDFTHYYNDPNDGLIPVVMISETSFIPNFSHVLSTVPNPSGSTPTDSTPEPPLTISAANLVHAERVHVDRDPPLKLPARFSDKAFRQYEGVIAEVVQNWPSPTEFTTELSTETFSARLRDAMWSYKEHDWHSTLIPRDKFLRMFPDRCVRQTTRGTVWVCHKDDRDAVTAVKAKAIRGPRSDDKPPFADKSDGFCHRRLTVGLLHDRSRRSIL